jgi:hypothetical protein
LFIAYQKTLLPRYIESYSKIKFTKSLKNNRYSLRYSFILGILSIKIDKKMAGNNKRKAIGT